MHLSITYSFVLVALGAVVCHAVHQTTFLADVPCNKLLVWFKASSMPSILDPHETSGMSCSCPESWRSYSSVSADWSLHRLQQVIGGADIGVGQLKALNMGLDSNWVGQFRPPLGQTLPPRVRTSYPACIARNGSGPATLHALQGMETALRLLGRRFADSLWRSELALPYTGSGASLGGGRFPTEVVRGRTLSQASRPQETYWKHS